MWWKTGQLVCPLRSGLERGRAAQWSDAASAQPHQCGASTHRRTRWSKLEKELKKGLRQKKSRKIRENLQCQCNSSNICSIIPRIFVILCFASLLLVDPRLRDMRFKRCDQFISFSTCSADGSSGGSVSIFTSEPFTWQSKGVDLLVYHDLRKSVIFPSCASLRASFSSLTC